MASDVVKISPLQCPLSQTNAMKAIISDGGIEIIGVVSIVCVQLKNETPTYIVSEKADYLSNPGTTPYFLIKITTNGSGRFFLTRDGEEFWCVVWAETGSAKKYGGDKEVTMRFGKDRQGQKIGFAELQHIKTLLAEQDQLL